MDEVGKGSMFTILLPRAVMHKEAMIEPPALRTKLTVLIVEDEKGVRDFMGRVLSQEGYSVLEATNGEEALELLRLDTHVCALIITDVIMPRMNGPALVERLRSVIPCLKVLYISGYTGDMINQNGLNTKEPFLQKPFAPTALTNKVAEVLGS